MRVAVACGDTLGEAPSWSMRENCLYWIDVRGPALHRFSPANGQHEAWQLPELCGGAVPARSGVLLALLREIAHFDPHTGRLERLAEVEPASCGNRLNEAKCDRAGRLWVGSMRDFGAAATGALYRFDGALRPDRVFTGVTVPNGLGWSPDNRTMYFTDTREGTVRAYAYDPAAGTPGAMTALVAPGALPGRPDGCTVDAEGHLWGARFRGGCVVRVAPDGRVSDLVRLPVSQPTSCALGGPDLRTLFVTTARQKLDVAELAAEPAAGHLLAIDVDVPGLPEPEFAWPPC